jgi:uncharacterized protein YndB with AHSA1/START domain
VIGGRRRQEGWQIMAAGTAASSTGAGASQVPELVITRQLEAPRDLVWKAWTDAQDLSHWWGPKGCKLRVVSLELRPGGVFHYAMQFRPGQETFGRFVYREIAPPERLVYVSSFSDAEGGITRAPFPQLRQSWPLEVLNTLTLTEADGRTTLTLRGSPINATQAELETFAGMFDSMRQGFGGTFDELSAYLAEARRD